MDSIMQDTALDNIQHQYDPHVDMRWMPNVEGCPDVEMIDVQVLTRRSELAQRLSLQQLAVLALHTSKRIVRAVRHHRYNIQAEIKLLRVLERILTGDFPAPLSGRRLRATTKQIESVVLFLSRLAKGGIHASNFHTWFKIHRQGFLRLKSKSYRYHAVAGTRRARPPDMEEQGKRDHLDHVFTTAHSQHVWELDQSSPYKRRQKNHACSILKQQASHDLAGSDKIIPTTLVTIVPEDQPKLHDYRPSLLKPPKWLEQQEQYDGNKVLQGKMSTDFQMRKSKWAPDCFKLTRPSTMVGIHKALQKLKGSDTHANQSSSSPDLQEFEHLTSIHELADLLSNLVLEDHFNWSLWKNDNNDEDTLPDPKSIILPPSQTQTISNSSGGMISSISESLSAKSTLLSPQTKSWVTADSDTFNIGPIVSSKQNYVVMVDEESGSSPSAQNSSTVDIEMSDISAPATNGYPGPDCPPLHTHNNLCEPGIDVCRGSTRYHVEFNTRTPRSNIEQISVAPKKSKASQSVSASHQLTFARQQSENTEKSSAPEAVHIDPMKPPPNARRPAPIQQSMSSVILPQRHQQSAMSGKVHSDQADTQGWRQSQEITRPATANAPVVFVIAQPTEPVNIPISPTQTAPPKISSVNQGKGVPRPASATASINFSVALDPNIIAVGPPGTDLVHPASSLSAGTRAPKTLPSVVAAIPFSMLNVQNMHAAPNLAPIYVPSTATTCSNEPVASSTSSSAPPLSYPTSNVSSAGEILNTLPSSETPVTATIETGVESETRLSTQTSPMISTPDHHDSGYWSRNASPRDHHSSPETPDNASEAMELCVQADLVIDVGVSENLSKDDLLLASTIHGNCTHTNDRGLRDDNLALDHAIAAVINGTHEPYDTQNMDKLLSDDTDQSMTINLTEMTKPSVKPIQLSSIHDPVSFRSYMCMADAPQPRDDAMDFILQTWSQSRPLVSGPDLRAPEIIYEATSPARSSSNFSVPIESCGKRRFKSSDDSIDDKGAVICQSPKKQKYVETSDECNMRRLEARDSTFEIDFLPKTWSRSSNHPRIIQHKPKPPRKPFHVASIISTDQDDEVGGPYWRQLRCLRDAFSELIFWDEEVTNWFVRLINQCKWLDARLEAYRPRWQMKGKDLPVTVDTLNEMADYEPGVIVKEYIPEIPESRPDNFSDFHTDLEMLVQFKPQVWKHLISALLQMDISLVILLGGPNHIRENDSLTIMQPESYIYNLRMIDDLDAQRSNYWNIYDEFLDWTQLEDADSEDFHALLSMVLRGGYFSELSAFLTSWLTEDEENREQFEAIIEQSGFVRRDDEDGYLAIYQKISDYLETRFTFESHKRREGAKILLTRCIEWRYPRWHQRIWPEEREDDFLDWLDDQEDTALEDVWAAAWREKYCC